MTCISITSRTAYPAAWSNYCYCFSHDPVLLAAELQMLGTRQPVVLAPQAAVAAFPPHNLTQHVYMPSALIAARAAHQAAFSECALRARGQVPMD